ncbi:uncharacterized protein LACBIDRAFT_310467 [Laccaria bicolor S238N-H82]|uniref:intramembrane prenyl-peptidase Rce1 n=1 Tax=Laccaria bicolor (strain S238N-H82 / ATCC MYA-4686) TaxID=486041 RepID=B0DUE5_LACBS|nr:uncharacterized protein LACBIDRAFT_310467 [Laccaria bicolor S238N-H82]EDR01790.1 predicted protein [Laccaria bicolor S238N-H82]|eukprot:XP_001887603.1 predicted protein [Laccaria bicolor S238N-H82]
MAEHQQSMRKRKGTTRTMEGRVDPDVIRARLLAVLCATTVCCSVFVGVVWAGHGFRRAVRFSHLFQVVPCHEANKRLHKDTPKRPLTNPPPPRLPPTLLLPKPKPEARRDPTALSNTNPLPRTPLLRRPRRSTPVPEELGVGEPCYEEVLYAPITEEIVFRACILSVYHLSGASTLKMIFLAPLAFGLAHVHHAWDTYNRYGRTPSAAKRALFTSRSSSFFPFFPLFPSLLSPLLSLALPVSLHPPLFSLPPLPLFQLTYTSVFGFHTSYLFLRMSSILPPISAHVFCNVMGVPDLGWELGRFRDRRGGEFLCFLAFKVSVVV